MLQPEADVKTQEYPTAQRPALVPPRKAMDPSLRLRTYGRIRPLEADLTWWERMFRR